MNWSSRSSWLTLIACYTVTFDMTYVWHVASEGTTHTHTDTQHPILSYSEMDTYWSTLNVGKLPFMITRATQKISKSLTFLAFDMCSMRIFQLSLSPKGLALPKPIWLPISRWATDGKLQKIIPLEVEIHLTLAKVMESEKCIGSIGLQYYTGMLFHTRWLHIMPTISTNHYQLMTKIASFCITILRIIQCW